jgi:hypothetical protein
LGYNDSCGFFMCELKVVRGGREGAANGSRSSVKLYGSSAIHGLMEDIRETPALATDDWNHIQRIFLGLRPN